MHPQQPEPPRPVPGPPPQHDPIGDIDTALGGTEHLEQRPIGEHVERFEAAHTALSAALSSIDKV